MSLRNLLKRHLPNKEKLQAHGSLNFLADHLHDPNLWHIHRRSSAGGAAVGAFCAFIPLPIQMACAAILAILFRVNLPLAVVFSLISNPITIPPMFFYAHKLGSWLLGIHHKGVQFQFSWDWFISTFVDIWQPLVLGCSILAIISASITYFLVRLIWRFTSINKWLGRRKFRNNGKSGGM
ncbi:MAG: DUF2062 domain-containing protein [Gammaproteobacteria bacterium]